MPKNVLVVAFRQGSTIEARAGALRAVGGEIVGGWRNSPNRYYYIRIPATGDSESLVAFMDSLKAEPSVESAGPLVVLGVQEVRPVPEAIPPFAPDSLPAALIDSLYDPANLARDGSQVAPFPHNAILVRFREDATYAQKVSAISAIHGKVVGGIAIAEDGYYLVTFAGDGTVSRVISVIATIEAMTGVAHALTLAPEEFHD